jgi:SAM-dependent methyltransferase
MVQSHSLLLLIDDCNLFESKNNGRGMMKAAGEIQAEFDRIALAEGASGWNHNSHYHDFLLRHVPAHCTDALDVGCGKGDFVRLLARRSDHVLGIDLSPEMLRLSRQLSVAYPNVEYEQADVMQHPLPSAAYDCIVSIATLHHLPLSAVLPRLKAALKPSGVLLVLDVSRDETLGDFVQSLVAIPVNQVFERIHNRNQSPASAASRAAWDAHGHDDHYLSTGEVRLACADLLPGARVTRHLLWRYSLVWTKPV